MATTTEKKKFSGIPKTSYIEVDGIDYVIEQMTGEQNEEYRHKLTERYDLDPNDPTKVRLKRPKGMYQDLFNLCLFVVVPGSQRQPCPENLAAKWSDECCAAVFDEIQAVTGMNKSGQDEAKKD